MKTKISIRVFAVLICSTLILTSCKANNDVSDVPEMMKDDEAFMIISQEAKVYNVDLERNIKAINNVSNPIGYYYGELTRSFSIDLVIDGFDENTKIGFEYLSLDDYRDLDLQAKTASKSISDDESVKKNGLNLSLEAIEDSISQKDEKLYIKVFDTVKKESKDELKKQARKYFRSLAKEGIIERDSIFTKIKKFFERIFK